MQTSVLVALAALSLVGVGVVGASGVMAPAPSGSGGMQGGMGGGMMGGGPGMHQGPMMDPDDMMGGGACGCQDYCQQHNYTWNRSYSGGS